MRLEIKRALHPVASAKHARPAQAHAVRAGRRQVEIGQQVGRVGVVDPEDEAAVIADDDEVSVGGHGDGPGLRKIKDAGERRVQSVAKIVTVAAPLPAQVIVEHARRIHEPHAAVLVGAEEVGAIRPECNPARAIDVAVHRKLAFGRQWLGDVPGNPRAQVRPLDAEQAGRKFVRVFLGAVADVQLTVHGIHRDVRGVAEAHVLAAHRLNAIRGGPPFHHRTIGEEVGDAVDHQRPELVGIINQLLVRADPQGAAGGIPVRLRVVDDGGHYAVGVHAADAVVAGIEQIDHAVGEHEQSVGVVELQTGRGGRGVAVEARDMGSGEGVYQTVGRDFQNRMARLVCDVNVPVGVGRGHVRVRERGGAGHGSLRGVRPKIDRCAVRIARGGVTDSRQRQRGAEAGRHVVKLSAARQASEKD